VTAANGRSSRPSLSSSGLAARKKAGVLMPA
jgi:hypothetical protein